MSKHEDIDVNAIYQAGRAEITPPESVNEIIHQVAVEESVANASQHTDPASSRLPRLKMPLAIAASLVLGVSVLLQVLIGDSSKTAHQAETVTVSPMFNLQRSREQSPEVWISRIDQLVEQGELDQARSMVEQFRILYPEHQLDSTLLQRLK